jgi:hypothetical protein
LKPSLDKVTIYLFSSFSLEIMLENMVAIIF